MFVIKSITFLTFFKNLPFEENAGSQYYTLYRRVGMYNAHDRALLFSLVYLCHAMNEILAIICD